MLIRRVVQRLLPTRSTSHTQTCPSQLYRYYLMRLGKQMLNYPNGTTIAAANTSTNTSTSRRSHYTPLEARIMKWYGPNCYVRPGDLESLPNDVVLVDVHQLTAGAIAARPLGVPGRRPRPPSRGGRPPRSRHGLEQRHLCFGSTTDL
jgi:hypothetical protein